MSRRRILSAIISALVVAALAVPAFGGGSSVELGQKLFSDPALGGSPNDKSCQSCHAGGTKLDNAADSKKLVDRINRCVTGPMEGTKIDGRSVEMRSLKLYTQSLAKSGQ